VIVVRAFTVLVLMFLIAPIVVVFPLSFSSGELLTLPTPGFSWRWYEDFFTSSKWLLATRNSFVVGIATAIIATLLGTLGALGIFLGRFRGKALLVAMLSTPMVVPVVVTAVAVYFGFSFVGLNNTLAGLILAHTVLSVPYVLITVLATLQTFDRNLLKAAATCGAPPQTAFRRVVLPLIAPGVATGALFAFATSFDELVVAIFVASPGQFFRVLQKCRCDGADDPSPRGARAARAGADAWADFLRRWRRCAQSPRRLLCGGRAADHDRCGQAADDPDPLPRRTHRRMLLPEA